MAVQTAVMNSPFINFCFPGAVLMEYDMDKSLDGSLLGEMGSEEGGDFRETTRDLLSFIDSASSNIKLALDKPVKSKRKVNHRKYLQKQIKRCTGIISPLGNPAPAAPGPGLGPNKRQGSGSPTQAQPHTSPFQPGKPILKRDGLQANLQSKSLAALFKPVKDPVKGERAKKPPLRHRNLPLSFFTEPANSPTTATNTPGVTSTSGMFLEDLERGGGNPEAADFFELLGPDYSQMLGDQDLFQPQSRAGRVFQHLNPDINGPDQALPPSYDPQQLVGGFLYAEPWSTTSCTGPSKKGGENTRNSLGPQTMLYSHSDPPMTGSGEDNTLCALAFSNYFPDCSVPQVSYDLSGGGYTRTVFSSLQQ
ncbi:protein FAM181B [Esox lucius]|uniref:Family with sequence similarity 181 member B n=1 Tax=Esox lucius TaxID=8010 RepID=A0A3P8Z603_ESOLU|nr:protein FAM181B [Esox lucius]